MGIISRTSPVPPVQVSRHRLRRALLAAARLLPALLPMLAFVPFVLAPPLNHDVAAVLSFSQRWFAGERLYADLIDVNPPLIYVLNLIPAVMEAATGLDAVICLQLCLVAFGALAWALSLRVRERAAEGAAERAFLDVLPGIFLFGAGYDFGQREHLMVVAALPYLLSAALRQRGRRPRAGVAIGVLAAIGFALKPHFLAVPALVELAVLVSRLNAAPLRTTLRDPVPGSMAAVWALYLLSLPLVFPDYLNVIVPLVWDYYLDLGDATPWNIFLKPRMATVLVLLAPLLWITARTALRPGQELPRTLCLAALGALAAAVAQHKGWSYHIVPIELLAGALAAVLAARWLDRAGAVSGRAQAARIAGVLGGLIQLYSVSNGELPWKELDYSTSDVAGLTQLLQAEAEGERVLVLSPGISPIFPALNYAHARLTLRTMNMWLLEGAYHACLPDGRRYREVWEMGRPEFFVYRTVAEDFARAPPAVVLVDKQPGIPWCGEEFDFIAYFSRHQLFAEVWSHYQQTAQWGRYLVFTRKDE
jgi:hypothetical protein